MRSTRATFAPRSRPGCRRDAIRDAFYVAYLFNTYDRLADTLGWELPDESYYPKAGQFLLKKGYL
jgi:hypothetical protein